MKRVCLGFACVLASCAAVARAEPEEAGIEERFGLVRVISEEAEVRTGPGFTFRVVYAATRGETFRALARATREFWFRVELPDGTFGWILGDQVLPIAVDPTAPEPPGFFGRIADALFAPAPLATGDAGLSFSAGVLGGEGLILFRPAVLLAPHLAIEGFAGETVGDQRNVIYYGGSANLYLWPTWPFTPFFSLGGGGAWRRYKPDQAAPPPNDNLAVATVGGGFLLAFKKRVTLRFDIRNYVVYDPNRTQELQEYSGGLAVVF